MNNQHLLPLPPPNATLIRPRIVQCVQPLTQPIPTQMYHYQPQIVHRSQPFAYHNNPHHQQIATPQQQSITIQAPHGPHPHQSYPHKSFTHKNNTNSHTNHRNKRNQNNIIQLGDFCIDKTPNKYRTDAHSTPHYKVINEIPLPLPAASTIANVAKSLRCCFNCGGSHFVRDCKQKRDSYCIQFNRYLKDKYDGKKNKKSFFEKKFTFRNQRYFDLNSNPCNEHKSNNGSSIPIGAWNKKANNEESQSFDEYLKSVQNEQKRETQIETKENGDVAVEEEEGKKEKIGFMFDAEIECLAIFKTKEEIESAQMEYKKQMENDKKVIESNWKRNKYERNNYNNTSNTIASSKYVSNASTRDGGVNHKHKKPHLHPNDIDRRRARVRAQVQPQRDYRHTESENDDRDYRKRRATHRNYSDRDRDRDSDKRSRSRHDHDRRPRHKYKSSSSRSGSNDRHRDRNRDRQRDRDRDRDSYRLRYKDRDRYGSDKSKDEPIDYGFGKKKEKIKKWNDKDDRDKYGNNERYGRSKNRH